MSNDPTLRTITDEDAKEIARQVMHLARDNLYAEVGHSTVAWVKRIIIGVGFALIIWGMNRGWKLPSI